MRFDGILPRQHGGEFAALMAKCLRVVRGEVRSSAFNFRNPVLAGVEVVAVERTGRDALYQWLEARN